MTIPCPACSADRPSFEAACPACGWTPKTRGKAQPQPLPASKPGGKRAGLLLIAGFLLVLALCGGGFAIYWNSREIGAACKRDQDCNSQKCLFLFDEPVATEGAAVCTDFCETDADCPDDMACSVATRGRGPRSALDDNQRSVCSPREFELAKRALESL